jgi:DNA repair exonuclease SbcCD nuclease subunit
VIYISDLHLRPESEDVVFSVLEQAAAMAVKTGHSIGVLGDVWHVRYAIPVYLLNRMRRFLKESGAAWYILPGNHDQIDIAGNHALEVFSDLPNVKVFHEPTWHLGTGCWLPYRKRPQDLVDWIQANPNPRPDVGPDVAHLHHGIVGAHMNNGAVAGELDGLRPDQLPFSRVYCGHWHRHQEIAQCVYVGSQWQTRADEAGQVKGVVVSELVFPSKTGPSFRFVPLDVGRRHHRIEAFTAQEIQAVRAGDTVRVPPGTSPKMVDALVKLGAEVFAEAAGPAQTGPRLGVDAAAPLRVQAEKYLATQAIPETLTASELMAVYDEVAT